MKITIIVPIYNEEENLNYFYNKITEVLKKVNYKHEIIFINDGSSDDSIKILKESLVKNNNIKIITLSKNYGKEMALIAGLDYATGDAIIPIDVDLQDPPEVILQMIKKWEEGYDIVCTVCTKRNGEKLYRRILSKVYRMLFKMATKINIPKSIGDFSLIDKKVLMPLKEMQKKYKFLKIIYHLIGFKKTCIEYQREPRYNGKSKWNFFRLLKYGLRGIIVFSLINIHSNKKIETQDEKAYIIKEVYGFKK